MRRRLSLSVALNPPCRRHGLNQGTQNRNNHLETVAHAKFEELDLSLFHMKPVEQAIQDALAGICFVSDT